jgi:hypothetical protein
MLIGSTRIVMRQVPFPTQRGVFEVEHPTTIRLLMKMQIKVNVCRVVRPIASSQNLFTVMVNPYQAEICCPVVKPSMYIWRGLSPAERPAIACKSAASSSGSSESDCRCFAVDDGVAAVVFGGRINLSAGDSSEFQLSTKIVAAPMRSFQPYGPPSSRR